MKLVLDMNVVIDWLVFDDPFLAAFRASVLEGRVTVVTHEPALVELRRVLAYPQLRLSADRQANVLARYEAQTALLPAASEPLPERFPECRDPDDDPFSRWRGMRRRMRWCHGISACSSLQSGRGNPAFR